MLVRADENLADELEAEARAEGRTRHGWVLHLLRTHPARPANKKK